MLVQITGTRQKVLARDTVEDFIMQTATIKEHRILAVPIFAL